MSKHIIKRLRWTTPLGPTGGQRLYSLDALRGFDMFWIMGAEEIFNTAAKATDWPALNGDFKSAHTSGMERISFVRSDFPAFFIYGRRRHAIFRWKGT